eukprot:TRINITY_DN22646_c0_g2_i3.p1 TRINITY_DN22646_c0_g2~~TRINITY_DN22646_c0_g2_i3.p1  ORF type:complete len:127 (-),score=15.84 TRINITY_DN22646_c0_g2_i3:81-461(-)
MRSVWGISNRFSTSSSSPSLISSTLRMMLVASRAPSARSSDASSTHSAASFSIPAPGRLSDTWEAAFSTASATSSTTSATSSAMSSTVSALSEHPKPVQRVSSSGNNNLLYVVMKLGLDITRIYMT